MRRGNFSGGIRNNSAGMKPTLQSFRFSLDAPQRCVKTHPMPDPASAEPGTRASTLRLQGRIALRHQTIVFVIAQPAHHRGHPA
jgi:hypothetical protein